MQGIEEHREATRRAYKRGTEELREIFVKAQMDHYHRCKEAYGLSLAGIAMTTLSLVIEAFWMIPKVKPSRDMVQLCLSLFAFGIIATLSSLVWRLLSQRYHKRRLMYIFAGQDALIICHISAQVDGYIMGGDEGQPSMFCCACGKTSEDPKLIEEKYCPYCKKTHLYEVTREDFKLSPVTEEEDDKG